MRINRVTITGVDDNTNPADLYKLSQKYPFVEWGILYSQSRTGQARYPTSKWITNLLYYDLQLSAHFCGAYSRSILENADLSSIYNLNPKFQRIQLNHNFKTIKTETIIRELFITNLPKQIIFQYNNSTRPRLENVLHDNPNSQIAFLYDSSGGRGTEIKSIASPIKGYYTGYSGGISPDNIDNIIEQITNYSSQENVWIDMESGVRTNNEFDLEKAELILSKVNESITNEN